MEKAEGESLRGNGKVLLPASILSPNHVWLQSA